MANFQETPWCQTGDILVGGEPLGRLQVCHLEEMPEQDEGPFVRQERDLLDAIAERLGRIVERLRAQEALRRSESRLRLAHQLAQLGHWDWLVETNELFWSEEVFRIFGQDPEHFQPTVESFEAAIHPGDLEAFLAEREGALVERRNVSIEHRIVWPDGTVRHVHELAEIVRDDQGQVVNVLGTVQDITERKWAEQALQEATVGLEAKVEERTAQLRQTNRALRLLSHCGRAVVRATDEGELLDEVCRLIVETGGYRLAWVGLAEQDESRTVRPVAQAGYEEGYLETLDITWADTERGRGPTGTAIRTGEPCAAQDILADPRFSPWREQAIQRGYASSLALPLAARGRTLGALNIYAVEPDAFDENEVDLLRDLADDLAFGLSALRTRADRQRAEEELRREKEFVEGLIETAQIAIAVLDPQGRIVRINRYLEDLSGYSLEEVRGRDWFDTFLPEGDRARIRDLFSTAVGGVQTRGNVNPIAARDGREYEIEWYDNTLRGAGGQAVGLLAVGQDVTERRRAERALRQHAAQLEEEIGRRWRVERELRQSEERFRGIFEHAMIGMYRTTPDGRILMANPALVRMLGYASFEELVERHLLESHYGPGFSRADFMALMEHEGRAAGLELTWVRCDGTTLFVRESARAVRDRGGEILYYEGTVEDITVRKRAEEQVARLTEEAAEAKILREVDRLRSELIANVSHEIRTPLGLIEIAVTSLLMGDVVFDLETQRQFLVGIRGETDRLKAIVDDLLVLGHIESGRIYLRRRPTDIGSLAQRVMDTMEVHCGQNRLVHEFPKEALIVGIDSRQIEQVLRNLLSNAIKYSPEGGTIAITGRQEGAQIIICVSDQGIGIPPDEQERIFERFYRVDSNVAWQAGGTGLGLSVCRGIVQAHGGQIWVESTPGEGSRFSFSLPTDVE